METNDYFMDEQLFSTFYDKAVELVEKEGFTDVFTEPSTQAGRGGDFFWATKDGVNYRGSYDYEEEQEIFYNAAVNADSEEEAIANLAKAYANLIISNLTVDEEDYDDDIDEMLTESEEKYELSTLVKDSINHLVNDLGKDPMADNFGDDVCADLENNYDIDVPQNFVKYADWCDAVMSEVSRQINSKEKQLTEAASKHVLPNADWAVEVDGDMLGTDYEDRDEAIESLNKFLEENNMDPEEVEYYVYQDFRSLNQNELSAYLANIFEKTYKTRYKYYKRFVDDIVRFIKDNYNFPKYQMQTIEKDAYNIAYVMTEILEDKFA